jgi:hypothetical protein
MKDMSLFAIINSLRLFRYTLPERILLDQVDKCEQYHKFFEHRKMGYITFQKEKIASILQIRSQRQILLFTNNLTF